MLSFSLFLFMRARERERIYKNYIIKQILKMLKLFFIYGFTYNIFIYLYILNTKFLFID